MSDKPRISLLLYSMAGGGAERVASVLLDELKEKFDITLVLMCDRIEYELPQGQKIYFLERSNPFESGVLKLFKLPFLAWRYAHFCRLNGIDASFSLTNRPNYINILSKLFGSTSRIIISERAQPSKQYGYLGMQSSISKKLIRLLYPLSDVITANSSGNASDLTNNFGIKSEIITIQNPFDIASIEQKAAQPLELAADTIVTVGRMDAGKNHALLIKALSKLKNKETNLLILGDGELRGELQGLALELGVADRVKMPGFCQNPFAVLSKASIFVFASNHEGFPNALVEALACGCAVVSADCPSGPREILAPDTHPLARIKSGVEFAQFGILVPSGDLQAFVNAIDVLFDDKNMRQNYQAKAKMRAMQFDKSIVMKNFIELFESK